MSDRPGTREVPEVVAAILYPTLLGDGEVTLALDLPVSETERVDEYLASEGGEEDLDRLSQGAFWHRDLQDGRSTIAMVGLLDDVRYLRGLGSGSLDVVLLEEPMDRDGAAAEHLALAHESMEPGAITVALVDRSRSSNHGEELRSLVAALEDVAPVTTLVVAHGDGTRWYCVTEEARTCDSHPVEGEDLGEEWFIDMERSPGLVYVGPVSASPPLLSY